MTNNFPLYADETMQMELVAHPATKGHIKVLSAKDVKTLEELSTDEFVQLFFGASYAATALFELLGAQGTNILLNESDSTLCIDVVARGENDGLNLLWEPKQGDPNELKDVAKAIRDKADQLVWARDNPEAAKKAKTPLTQGKATEIKKEIDTDGHTKENYLLRSLRRTP